MKKKLFKTKMSMTILIICLSIVFVSGAVYYQIAKDEQNVENNGYYEDSGEFDKEMTPVSNMLIILKVINGSNFCDDDWYEEVKECQCILKAQIKENANSKDPYVKKMMELQQNIVNKMHPFTTSAWLPMLSTKDIDNLQKAYDAYHDYYYENYGEQGAV